MKRMNRSHFARSYRRKHKRGVSPIIATILLVAITVVLAAVLYVLVSGLTKSGASTPYEVVMTATNQATGTNTYFDIMTLSPTTGLTTSMFGLKVTQLGGTILTLLPTASLPATCTQGSAPTPAICTGVTGDWYGLIVSGTTGDIVAIYTAGGWAYASGSTLALTNGYTLYVVTYVSFAGSGAVISAYSTGTSSVSGSGNL